MIGRILLSILGLAAASAMAETPELRQEFSQDAQGGKVLHLRSSYASRMVAWAVIVHDPSGRRTIESHDAVMGGRVVEAAIPIRYGSDAYTAGAIFDDGSTAGDAEAVRVIMEDRRGFLRDIPEVIALLEANRADREKARQIVEDRRKARLDAFRADNSGTGPRAEAVALAILKEDRSAEAVSHAVARLQQLQSRLEASRPPLR